MAGSECDAMFNVVLEEEVEQVGAEPKFKIRGVKPRGGSHLVNEEMGDSHLVQCDMVQVCHGKMSPSGSPASIIVFLFAFQPFRANKRFKWVEIVLTFKAAKSEEQNPVVSRIAPAEEYGLLPSEKAVVIGQEVSASLEGGFAGLKGATGYKWTSTTTSKKEASAWITGKTLARGAEQEHHNIVKWGLYENEQTKSGIPTLLQAAVLLERNKSSASSDGDHFSAELEIRGKVNVLDEVKTMAGRREKGVEKIFNPGEDRKCDIENEKNLESVDLTMYQRLWTTVRWPGDGKAQTPVSPANSGEKQLESQPQNEEETLKLTPQEHFESTPPRTEHKPIGNFDDGCGTITPQPRRPMQSSSVPEPRLERLRGQLEKVRIEMDLVRQLMNLMEKEWNILHEEVELLGRE